MFHKISVVNKYYKQPYQIGEILEHEGELHLIVGIHRIRTWGNALKITYLTQDMRAQNFKNDYDNHKAYISSFRPFWVDVRTGDRTEERLEQVDIGEILIFEGEHYQIMEYTGVSFKFTDITITLLAKKIVPASREVIKKAIVDFKKEKAGFVLIE